MKTTLLLFALTSISVYAGAGADLRTPTAKMMATEFSHALDMYFVDCHQFPRTLSQLTAKPKDCKNWGPDPYLKTVANDPWGHPWQYKRIDSKSYELKSLGADGKEGGVGENMDFVYSGRAPELSK